MRFPTFFEVIDTAVCILTYHDWETVEEDGRKVVRCSSCGARKE